VSAERRARDDGYWEAAGQYRADALDVYLAEQAYEQYEGPLEFADWFEQRQGWTEGQGVSESVRARRDVDRELWRRGMQPAVLPHSIEEALGPDRTEQLSAMVDWKRIQLEDSPPSPGQIEKQVQGLKAGGALDRRFAAELLALETHRARVHHDLGEAAAFADHANGRTKEAFNKAADAHIQELAATDLKLDEYRAHESHPDVWLERDAPTWADGYSARTYARERAVAHQPTRTEGLGTEQSAEAPSAEKFAPELDPGVRAPADTGLDMF
jgi:hypothetical protein